MEILIDFMEANDYSEDADDLWKVLLARLNNTEGAIKNMKAWRRVWDFLQYQK